MFLALVTAPAGMLRKLQSASLSDGKEKMDNIQPPPLLFAPVDPLTNPRWPKIAPRWPQVAGRPCLREASVHVRRIVEAPEPMPCQKRRKQCVSNSSKQRTWGVRIPLCPDGPLTDLCPPPPGALVNWTCELPPSRRTSSRDSVFHHSLRNTTKVLFASPISSFSPPPTSCAKLFILSGGPGRPMC